MGQADHRNANSQIRWRSGRFELAGGRNRRRSRDDRRSERAVSDYGRLYQTHASRSRGYGERLSQARVETAAGRHASRITVGRFCETAWRLTQTPYNSGNWVLDVGRWTFDVFFDAVKD